MNSSASSSISSIFGPKTQPFFSFVLGMDMAPSKLNGGGWVHIFPEGSHSTDEGKIIAPAKRGVASTPVIIPFVNTGMLDTMPVGEHIPRPGKSRGGAMPLSLLGSDDPDGIYQNQ